MEPVRSFYQLLCGVRSDVKTRRSVQFYIGITEKLLSLIHAGPLHKPTSKRLSQRSLILLTLLLFSGSMNDAS
jgi:hypothetical protein